MTRDDTADAADPSGQDGEAPHASRQPACEAIEPTAEEAALAILPALEMLSTLGGPYPTEIAPTWPRPAEGERPIDYLTPVQLQVLGLLLRGYTRADIARDPELRVSRSTVHRWEHRDENFRAAYAESMAEMRSATRPLLIDGFRKGVMELVDLVSSTSAKIRLGAATQLTRLYRPDEVGAVTAGNERETDTDAEWMRRFTTKGDAFLPHDTQLAAINCLARYLVLVAGVQSGKTDTGAINFWKRIVMENDPTAVYYLVAPTTGIGKVMRKRFVSRAPKGWLLNPSGSGQDFERTWKLSNGATVEFRSANKPENIVAETLCGAWLDEFTLMRATVWQVSLRGRLAATGGWVIFTGTPRGPTWAYEEVWRRTQPHDDLYDKGGNWAGFTWHSSANPRVSAMEVADAKATLPDAFFRREWQASWEAFHGQVFPDFSKAANVFDLTKVLTKRSEGTLFDAGVDWGYGSPGALVVGRLNADASWDIVHEVHEAKRLTAWWIERFKEAHLRFGAMTGRGIDTFWCDGAEPDRIVAARRALRKWAKELGIRAPRVRPGKKERYRGILHVASLFKQRRVRIHRACSVTIAQLQGYKFKEDREGDDTDAIEEGNDHTVDALRYMTYSRKRADRKGGNVEMGSA
ncbi:hypothetical protein LCGC14_0273010 [marine sediment metagenome]|uniref:Terminase n=2 Tax=root TaxID=1 RepID=A0A9C9NEK6_9HYPH|nr:hypothetical protein [Aurantimonas coralicida]